MNNSNTTKQKSWLHKYKPEKICDILGNEHQVFSICKWLDTFTPERKQIKKNDYSDDITTETPDTSNTKKSTIKKQNKNRSCIIISGRHGYGKTAMVKCILNEKKYEINNIDFRKLCITKDSKNEKTEVDTKGKKNKKSSECTNNYIDKIMKNNSIADLLTYNTEKNKVVLIDGIESAISPLEKTLIINILKHNEKEWVCPVIFISNDKHNKTISFIKSNSHEIKIERPTFINMKVLLYKICSNEKIFIDREDSDEIIKNIIDYSQYDYRKLIYTLEDFYELYPKKVITKKRFNSYISLSRFKDVDEGIFETAKNLMFSFNDINSSLKMYEIDRVTMPLMMQQNYISSLANNRSNNKLNTAKKISDSLAIGDIVENYIYGNQNWELQEVHGHLSCTCPSYHISSEINPTKKDKNSFYCRCEYPDDYNRTSIKKMNQSKHISTSNSYFENMGIDEYIYLNKIIRGMISSENIDDCKKLFEEYNCPLNIIESITKLDRTSQTKFVIPQSIKKKLQK